MRQSRLMIVLCLILRVNAHNTLFAGAGKGTYYYDISEVQVCGTTFVDQNKGNVGCSVSALSLDQISSNYIVAINNTQLHENLSTFCGKRIVLYVNGHRSDLPLFVGDGCARCADDSGVDLSYSVLNDMMKGTACENGHTPISWEIVDEDIYAFDTTRGVSSTTTGTGSDGSCATQSTLLRRESQWA